MMKMAWRSMRPPNRSGNGWALNAAVAGVEVRREGNGLRVRHHGELHPVDVDTSPHPGFPTDLQAQWVVLMSLAKGKSIVKDTVYNDRFSHVPELNRLGASIKLKENIAYIDGVDRLYGAEVMSTDIRASASMILGAMAAEGETHLSRIYHIDRGYEKIEKKLKNIGVKIMRVNS